MTQSTVHKRTIAKWDKEIKKHQDRVAKTRDDLDEYIEELEGLKESCRKAWDDLQSARDALSELV